MKNIKNLLRLSFFSVIAFTMSCKEDFLKISPNGVLDENVMPTYDGVDNLLIGAYSMLDGVSSNGFGWESASSNWVFGSIRGGEANKGTDAGDQPAINPIQQYSETATNDYLNVKWKASFDGVARCNSTINIAKLALEKDEITQAQYDFFVTQARALRGFYHFEAWRMWNKIPYVDENTTADQITNTVDVRDKIIADLTAAKDLPNDMGQIGRFNGTVVKVLLAKALMQMNGDFTAAEALLQDVVTNGTKPDGSAIGLEPKYGDIFDAANRNGLEAIYTVQYSVNDGSGGWNGGWGEVLNFPYKPAKDDVSQSPGGCCGFFQPTQEFVNSFRTSNGLPMLDGSYNGVGVDERDQGVAAGDVWDATVGYAVGEYVTRYDPNDLYTDRLYIALTGTKDLKGNCTACITNVDPLTNPADWDLIWVEDNSTPVDPRLDWSVGRRGIPYLDWGVHTGQDWIRDQSYAGPYSPKKQVYKKSQEGSLTEVGNWTSGWTANGYRLIRYADVLLLLAECKAENATGDLGLAEVNLVRARAANAAGYVMEDGTSVPAANYDIALYTAAEFGVDPLKAIRFERKLELGMEGHRFFDLQRWGTAQTELNAFLAYEAPRRKTLYGSATFGTEDVLYPIPQRQIDLSFGKIEQN